MELMKAIYDRRSCRAFAAQQVSGEQLDTLLLAANAAPVGGRKYEDVKLTVVQDKALLDNLNAFAAEFINRPGIQPTYGAPTVILVSAKVEEGSGPSPYCNAACIVENMHLAATDLGLGSVYLLGCMSALGASEELCKAFKVPEGFVPASALAVGIPAQPFEERQPSKDVIATEYVG